MKKIISNRQHMEINSSGVLRLGIYESCTGKYGYGGANDYAENRVIPTKVWIDENGYICAEVERRAK